MQLSSVQTPLEQASPEGHWVLPQLEAVQAPLAQT
jgi:hypothetical protein